MLLTSALLSLSSASTLQIPFNLHVLSLPPAFVLSHDQTLIFDLFNPVCHLLIKEFTWFLYQIHRLYSFSSFILYSRLLTLSAYPLLLLFTIFYNYPQVNSHHLTHSLPVMCFICHHSLNVNKNLQKKFIFLLFLFLASFSYSKKPLKKILTIFGIQ